MPGLWLYKLKSAFWPRIGQKVDLWDNEPHTGLAVNPESPHERKVDLVLSVIKGEEDGLTDSEIEEITGFRGVGDIRRGLVRERIVFEAGRRVNPHTGRTAKVWKAY